MNTLHLNSVRLNGIGEVQSVSLSAGADPEQPPVEPSKYIQFEDPAVEAICVANWSSDGIGLTMEDAAAVTSIGTTFKGNTEITSFNEFEYFTGVKMFAAQAFADCSSLRSIRLHTGITEIERQVFMYCSALSSINLEHISKIYKYAFYRCNLSGSLLLPSLIFIAHGVFYGNKITSVDDLGSITSITGYDNAGDSQVFGGNPVSSIVLPATMTTIEWRAFYNNSTLQKIICRATTPPTLVNVNAFTNTNNCPIYVPDASLEAYKTATNWSTYADRIHPLSEIEGSPYIQFEDPAVEAICIANWSSDGVGLTKEDAAAVTSLGTTFQNNTEIVSFEELEYFTGVTTIQEGAFRGCTSLEKIKLPHSVTSVGAQAFRECNLSGCNLDLDNVESLSAGAFYATKMRGIVMQEIRTVSSQWVDGYNTFGKCANLEYALFGTHTQSIAPYIFKNAAKCSMIVLATTPPAFNGDSFDYNGSPAFIYVPDSSVSAYSEASNWESYASKIKGISQLATDNPTLYEEIKDYLL